MTLIEWACFIDGLFAFLDRKEHNNYLRPIWSSNLAGPLVELKECALRVSFPSAATTPVLSVLFLLFMSSVTFLRPVYITRRWSSNHNIILVHELGRCTSCSTENQMKTHTELTLCHWFPRADFSKYCWHSRFWVGWWGRRDGKRCRSGRNWRCLVVCTSWRLPCRTQWVVPLHIITQIGHVKLF